MVHLAFFGEPLPLLEDVFLGKALLPFMRCVPRRRDFRDGCGRLLALFFIISDLLLFDLLGFVDHQVVVDFVVEGALAFEALHILVSLGDLGVSVSELICPRDVHIPRLILLEIVL